MLWMVCVFSCSSLLQDTELPEGVQDVVFVRSMNCWEPIEALYYSANLITIVIACCLCLCSIRTLKDTSRVYITSCNIETFTRA